MIPVLAISNLFASPLRLALVEKGLQSLAEVATHVAHEDEVFAFLTREPALQPRRKILDHFVEQSDPRRLLSSDESGSENEILHARRPDQGGEPADARHRKAIAKRAGNRKSESCRFRSHAQIAAGGNARSAAGARAGNRGNGRHAALFERRQHAIEPRFIFDRVLRRLKSAKLIDVGA